MGYGMALYNDPVFHTVLSLGSPIPHIGYHLQSIPQTLMSVYGRPLARILHYDIYDTDSLQHVCYNELLKYMYLYR